MIKSGSGKDVYLVGCQEALSKVPEGSIWVTEAEVKATVPAVGELVLRIKEVFGSENVRVRFSGKHVEGHHYVKTGLDYELEPIPVRGGIENRNRTVSDVRKDAQSEAFGESGQHVCCGLSGELHRGTENGCGLSDGRDGKGIPADTGGF